MRNLLRTAGLVIAAAALTAFIVSRTSSGSPSSAAGAGDNDSSSQFTLNSGSPAAGDDSDGGSLWHGRAMGHAGMGLWGPAAAGKVTNISGNTITVQSFRGSSIKVTVSSTTQYTKGGASAGRSDIHVGDRIVAMGNSSSSGSTTATKIMILQPTVAGVVTSVSGNTITVSGRDGVSYTIDVGSSTKYERQGQSASLTEISKGSMVMAEGTLTNGKLNASVVHIQVPHVFGTVTTVNGSSFTVTTRALSSATSQTITVNTSSKTAFKSAGGTSSGLSSVTKGSIVVASGTLSADGKTLQADKVLIAPPGTSLGKAPFFHRGFGGHDDFGPGGPGGDSNFRGDDGPDSTPNSSSNSGPSA